MYSTINIIKIKKIILTLLILFSITKANACMPLSPNSLFIGKYEWIIDNKLPYNKNYDTKYKFCRQF